MPGSTYITDAFAGNGNTGAISTHSVWVKRTNDDNDSDARSTIMSGFVDSNNYWKIRFADDDRVMCYGVHGGTPNMNIETNREFKDTFGWYHLVFQFDTTHATSSERVKIFVNGVQETSFNSNIIPGQNSPNYMTKDNVNIGGNQAGAEHAEMLMSHFHCVDGTIYPPSAFGETDATTGEWTMKTAPSVTYGAKGFFIFIHILYHI